MLPFGEVYGFTSIAIDIHSLPFSFLSWCLKVKVLDSNKEFAHLSQEEVRRVKLGVPRTTSNALQHQS